MRRNRIKRRLRELWAARLESVPRGNDYVLVVRDGLIEAADAQGCGVARRARGRGDREGARMKVLSLVLRSLFPSPGVPGAPTCKYHPTLLPVRVGCAAEARAGQGLAQDRVASRPL